MKIATNTEETKLREIGWGPMQESARCLGQLGDFGTTVTFKEEGRGSAGGVIAALILGLDDQRLSIRRNRRSEARPGDAAADDNDVKFVHFFRWLRIGKPRRL